MTFSEKPNSSDKTTNPSVTTQKPPLSLIPVAAVNAFRPVYLSDLSDFNQLTFPSLPPLLSRAVARKSKSYQDQKSLGSASVSSDITITLLPNKIFDEPSTSVNTGRKTPIFRTASDLSSEAVSLYIPRYPH